jgi:hypothetical protein
MENKKQSSIEWLVEQLSPAVSLQKKYIDEIKQQAKEKHKQEIKDTYWDGGQDIPLTQSRCEQYYNETYGK